MAAPWVIEVELVDEDWGAIRRAMDAAGPDVRDAMAWLLERGLDAFVADEAEWKALDGQTTDEAEARKQELKRREAQALLVSMRARTIAAEKVMAELGQTVHELGAELYANRRAMRPLREENAALAARLAVASGAGNGGGPSPGDAATHRGVVGWLRRVLGVSEGPR
ncbi:MAG: hypothetical protein QN174_00335 [Armatimonadota bacterium]|nr:hypothetical protein [Armatimonadota bacterium]MDR7456044.1 hypothetical protein [Armatimonadota bacterium]MDR7495394.1 hypothetical protein [Armatimonadota bacterium]MDR7511691.1 hypothetical protein [Armatimonadota bacterium]